MGTIKKKRKRNLPFHSVTVPSSFNQLIRVTKTLDTSANRGLVCNRHSSDQRPLHFIFPVIAPKSYAPIRRGPVVTCPMLQHFIVLMA